ncbi:MAG: PIN domain-containing protein [Pseudomonadota bacterium]
MKVFLDACVLYPTVLREVLLGLAAEGLYQPLWSPRVLEEWARATRKLGAEAEVQARGEIALLKARWPKAERQPGVATEARLVLPDANDVHVLAAASDGGADLLVTLNLRDFPKQDVRAEGMDVCAPDGFAMDLWLAHPTPVEAAVSQVHATARQMAGEDLPLRGLLKRAKLPRLGKALA